MVAALGKRNGFGDFSIQAGRGTIGIWFGDGNRWVVKTRPVLSCL